MKITSATALTAATTLVLQITALIGLEPRDFGLFSIVYLLFAFSNSLSQSLISDAWTRNEAQGNTPSGWIPYASVSTYFSVIAGAVALTVSLLVPGLASVALAAAIAVAAGTYRGTARFFSLRERDWKHILPGDVAGLVGLVTVFAAAAALNQINIFSVFHAWALSSALSSGLSRPATIQSPRILKDWFREHGTSMRPLIRDSLLMDAGAIWAPYLLIPILGVSNFGIYRAVSNVAAPVRLVITPLRPTIATISLKMHSAPRLVVPLLSLSAFAGVGAWAAIELISANDLQLGTLSSLASYAIAVGIFVSANLLGHFYSIVARNHLTSRLLFSGRLVQASFSFLAPLLAAFAWGLTGAIWALAIGALLSSLTWLAIITTRPNPRTTSPVLE